MTSTSSIDKCRNELKALADNIAFKEVMLPEFKQKQFSVERIRQERTYTRPDRGTQIIGRFLMERGVVDVLENDRVVTLFTEIHFCAYRLRVLGRQRYKTAAAARAALADARGIVGEMEAAEEELFIANRRLVVNCVKPFFWIGQVWISDFLQEGSKALTNAIRKFDFTRGTPFYAYAQISIKNRLRNFFRDHVRAGSIGVRPTREMQLVKKVMDEWKDAHDGESPKLDTLVKLTGIDEARIKKIRPVVSQWEHMPSPPVSLDAMVGEGEASLYNFIEDEKGLTALKEAEKAEVWSAIDTLPPRSKYIMRLRFIEGRTLEETGDMLNLTRARIKQIQDESLKKLRQMLGRGR